MTLKKMILASSFLLLLAGCASIAHGTSETIEAVSDPASADVAIDCGLRRVAAGVTPARLTISRKADHCMVHFSKQGFAETTRDFPRGFSRNYWGNLGLMVGFPAGIALAVSDGFGGTAPHETQANVLASIGVAGAVGLVVDRLNGAMYEHAARLSVKLRSQAPPLP